jgi:hypothetical protein
MTNTEAVLITSDDWAVLYVDGVAVSQAHSLERELLELAEQHGFTHSTLSRYEVTAEDDKDAKDCGEFPRLLKDLKGTYE